MIGILDFLLADLNPRSLLFAQTESLYVYDEATHILRRSKITPVITDTLSEVLSAVRL